MVAIGKTFTFEAAHRLQDHDGKCFYLHGHSYRVEVAIRSPLGLQETGSERGMVLDFGRLKEWWSSHEVQLDHWTILEENDPLVQVLEGHARVRQVPWPPTAEHFALWLAEDLATWLVGIWPDGFTSPSVRVYETATSWAEA